MTRLNLLVSAVVLAFAASAGGSAFGAGQAGWAAKAASHEYGANSMAPAEFKRQFVSSERFGRGYRHGFGKPRRRGARHRPRYWRDRYFFSFAFPYYRYDRYDYPYAPPPVPAPSAAPAPDGPSDCREVVMDVIIGGIEQKAYGTACQQADGSWKITN